MRIQHRGEVLDLPLLQLYMEHPITLILGNVCGPATTMTTLVKWYELVSPGTRAAVAELGTESLDLCLPMAVLHRSDFLNDDGAGAIVSGMCDLVCVKFWHARVSTECAMSERRPERAEM